MIRLDAVHYVQPMLLAFVAVVLWARGCCGCVPACAATWRPTAATCRGHAVIDHFNYDAATGAQDHAAVLASNYVQVGPLCGFARARAVLEPGCRCHVPTAAARTQLGIDSSPSCTSPRQSDAVLPGGLAAPVLYRGIGLSVAPGSETVRCG